MRCIDVTATTGMGKFYLVRFEDGRSWNSPPMVGDLYYDFTHIADLTLTTDTNGDQAIVFTADDNTETAMPIFNPRYISPEQTLANLRIKWAAVRMRVMAKQAQTGPTSPPETILDKRGPDGPDRPYALRIDPTASQATTTQGGG